MGAFRQNRPYEIYTIVIHILYVDVSEAPGIAKRVAGNVPKWRVLEE